MRRTLLFALSFAITLPAAAQEYRPAHALPELDRGSLSSIVLGQERSIEGCASRTDASTYVATVHARVSPGAAPSTLYGARIAIVVVSRPRDHEFEGCVRRSIADALRHSTYAVGRSVSARHTFQIAERRDPPIDRPPPPFDQREVQRVLASHHHGLQQCLELAGVPEQLTLRVAVRPDGSLVLTSADVPTGSASRALSCLANQVSRLRVSGRPARTVAVVHTLGVQSRPW
jgi:hypothetical protein